MRSIPLLLTLIIFLAGCDAPDVEPDEMSYAAAFVTQLGDDTLAVESFERFPDGMTATVMLRTPRTSISTYDLAMDEDGRIASYEVVTRDAAADSVVSRMVFQVVGDSMRVERTVDGSTTRSYFGAEYHMLPFIDMVHWPFDLMLTNSYALEDDSLTYVVFTENGTMDFIVEREGDGMMSVTHPYRGTMDVKVDPDGRLLELNASETTRKLVVRRVADVDVDAVAARYAALDSLGRSFGPLSGRGQSTATVDGATIHVDFGQPEKRGRDIFGALVPWGQIWRTGANQATHFETDRAIELGGLSVPAGRYTLYTIPEPDGGTLIVNTQTGQGGTTYDQALDLGRVEMTSRSLPESVETFQILVDDLEGGGELRLQWDRTEFVIPFRVGTSGP